MKPGGPLRRTGPIERKTPLTSSTPLTPGGPLRRTGGLVRGSPLARSAPPAKRRPSSDPDAAGSLIPEDMRDFVLARSLWSCDRCARYLAGLAYSIQHRNARGMGGRRGAHTPGNLILLCGSATDPWGCHHHVEHVNRTEAYRFRFAIRGELADPDETPVFRHLARWELPGVDGWVPSGPPDGWSPDH